MKLWNMATLGLGVALSGCAAYMPLAHDHDKVEPGKPVVLMTVTLNNPESPGMVPYMHHVQLTSSSGEVSRVPVDAKAKDEDAATRTNSYYVRLALAPGVYRLDHLYSTAQISAYVKPYYTHVLHDFSVPASGVVYLGNISGTLQNWRPGDVSAGPMPNLAGADHAGEVMGRMDVRISDRANVDLPGFRQRFAALQTASIAKAILPPYDVNKVKRYMGNDSSGKPVGTVSPVGSGNAVQPTTSAVPTAPTPARAGQTAPRRAPAR